MMEPICRLFSIVTMMSALLLPVGGWAQTLTENSTFCPFSNEVTSVERCQRLAELSRLKAIKARHRDTILSLPEVFGFGVGSPQPGDDALVFIVLVSDDAVIDDIPSAIEGVPVLVQRRAPVRVLDGLPSCTPPCHTTQQSAPVPMGVSGGWVGDSGGCTLGFKACDLGTGETVFVTNSHCNDFSTCNLPTTGTLGWEHPGQMDDPFGTRFDIGSITGHAGPSCSANVNLTDATKVASAPEETAARFEDLGWQAGGFIVVPGDRVEKSGRTTGSTSGTVTAVMDVDVDVPAQGGFCCGALTMTDQIAWLPDPGEETQGGDSGSALLVRVPNNAGSGDLFAVAGLLWGTDNVSSYSNAIGEVLAALNLSLNFTSCFSDCIFTEAAFAAEPSASAPAPRTLVNAAHRLRAQILARSAVGLELTQIYYQFTNEAVALATRQPRLLARTSRLLLRFAPNLIELVETGQTTVRETDFALIDRLLAAYQGQGSDAMAKALGSVRETLRNPEAQALLGFRISTNGD